MKGGVTHLVLSTEDLKGALTQGEGTAVGVKPGHGRGGASRPSLGVAAARGR